ncbi:hypothetical protein GOQ30_11415 [Flavobacterium sp. TP390]|uniref:DNA (cytosine-5-)-methyltransferase n=1 Tax=Flavobacterium profundi TaxID=1774945 RepID=A0A6I4IST2_9FLAO|nr:DNA cytosine methyltransferase [Flavobacterium profundi]MVO09767.1 hypothetical protein [Flavobacterium profundi]
MRINKQQYNLNFSSFPIDKNKITYGEFFAGGLGCATGASKDKNISVLWVLNHDKIACKTANFHLPNTKVYWSDIYVQDEKELEQVDIIQASFECDEHSNAKGSRPIDKQSYMMGWELYRYIKYLQPLVLTVENVPGVKKWGPLDENGKPIKERAGEEFERWKSAMISLGYEYIESIRCAADDGIPTTRTRYFAIFYKEGIDCSFPEYTHNENGTDGKEKWIACEKFIDLDNHGHSIFGRKFNTELPKNLRKPLVPNSQKRIAYGIKKESPDFHQFICSYYGGKQGIKRITELSEPLKTQTSENRHQLVTVEKMQFIADYCYGDTSDPITKPLRTQLQRQTKMLVTTKQFITQYYGNNQAQSTSSPLRTQPCRDTSQLVTTIEKIQFLCQYYNSNGNPEQNTQSTNKPLKPILQVNKHQLVTVLHDFDIKTRFLDAEELSEISTFPRDFFTREGLELSHKNSISLIGNAVPPEWFYKILSHNIPAILEYKEKKMTA